jgi:predicted HicB family RNase H-like nuclease
MGEGLPIPEPTKYTGQYHLRMPPSLPETLSRMAELGGVSLNQYMVSALARCADRDEALAGKGRA